MEKDPRSVVIELPTQKETAGDVIARLKGEGVRVKEEVVGHREPTAAEITQAVARRMRPPTSVPIVQLVIDPRDAERIDHELRPHGLRAVFDVPFTGSVRVVPR